MCVHVSICKVFIQKPLSLPYSIEKYTLQVSGEESYLDGKNELISFKDIRR